MNKIVTFESPEYYELLQRGWVVMEQVSPTAVMMAQLGGTAIAGRSGPPEEMSDPKWLPVFGGVAIPGVEEVPYVSYNWSRLIQQVNPNTGETVTMYKDLNTNDPVTSESRYTKVEAIDALGAIREQEIWEYRWTDSLYEWNWRLVATGYEIWRVMFSKVGVSAQFLVATALGPIQYRIVYSGSGTVHTFATWTLLLAEYNSGVLY